MRWEACRQRAIASACSLRKLQVRTVYLTGELTQRFVDVSRLPSVCLEGNPCSSPLGPITGHSVTPSKAAFQRRPGAATRHSRRRGLGCRLRPYSDNPSSGNSRPEAAQYVELAASHFALAPTNPTPIASPSPDSPSDSHAGRATSPWADSPIGRDTPLTHAGIARNISEARRIASVRLRVAAANP